MISETVNKQTTLDNDARELHEALTALLRVYQTRDRKRICCHDISVTQCYALRELVTEGSQALSALADRLHLDKSTASRVVDALERKGYVVRVTNPDDGRAVRVRVTPGGASLYRRIEADLVDGHRRLLADFDPEVRQATTRLIARLAREAGRRFSPEDGSCCA